MSTFTQPTVISYLLISNNGSISRIPIVSAQPITLDGTNAPIFLVDVNYTPDHLVIDENFNVEQIVPVDPVDEQANLQAQVDQEDAQDDEHIFRSALNDTVLFPPINLFASDDEDDDIVITSTTTTTTTTTRIPKRKPPTLVVIDDEETEEEIPENDKCFICATKKYNYKPNCCTKTAGICHDCMNELCIRDPRCPLCRRNLNDFFDGSNATNTPNKRSRMN